MTTGQQAPRVPGNRPSESVLVIIPTFNERESLPVIHRRLKDACPSVHLLIVDDSSPDGTGKIVDAMQPAESATPSRRIFALRLDLLDDLKTFKLGMAEIQRPVLPGIAMRQLKRLGPCPRLEIRLAAPQRV